MQDVFKKVKDTDPKMMDQLEELGKLGYRIAAYVPSKGRDIDGYFMLQREFLGDVDIEKAIREGIYDAFSGWVDEMSVATKRKIFSPNQD